MNSNWPGGSRAYKETTAILLNENKESGPAEALRQRRLSPQCFFPVKIRFFDMKKIKTLLLWVLRISFVFAAPLSNCFHRAWAWAFNQQWIF